MSELNKDGTQSVLNDPNLSSFEKYKRKVVGDGSTVFLFWYEVLTGLLGPLPGALGVWLRQQLYGSLFKSFGPGVIIGRNVAIRNPKRIALGKGVVIEENGTLDAKGTEGKGIAIGAGCFIGKGTIISVSGGTIEIDEGSNIGSYVRIGTLGHTRVGRKVLMAAYCYLVGAGHEAARTDIPILDQPNTSAGGVTVGDGAWLGARVTVMDGVTVGKDTIVGAHSLVTKDLPDRVIALGTPASVLRPRE